MESEKDEATASQELQVVEAAFTKVMPLDPLASVLLYMVFLEPSLLKTCIKVMPSMMLNSLFIPLLSFIHFLDCPPSRVFLVHV
jgi:hypothetical protein